MSRNRVLSAVCGVAVALAGCGGGTNNDQGVSFSHLGYFADLETGGSCEDLPTGLGGLVVSLGLVRNGGAFINPDLGQGSDALISDSSIAAVVGYRNNLNGQGVRVRRLLLTYFIPGATEQPPTTTIPLSAFLGPADDVGDNGEFDSTLPPSFAGSNQCGFSRTQIVPPAVFRWLIFNQDKLPETPFSMEVYSTIVADSTSGNTYESNTEAFFISFTPETAIPATDAAGNTGASTSEVSSDGLDDTTETETGLDTGLDTGDTDDSVETPTDDGSDL